MREQQLLGPSQVADGRARPRHRHVPSRPWLGLRRHRVWRRGARPGIEGRGVALATKSVQCHRLSGHSFDAVAVEQSRRRVRLARLPRKAQREQRVGAAEACVERGGLKLRNTRAKGEPRAAIATLPALVGQPPTVGGAPLLSSLHSGERVHQLAQRLTRAAPVEDGKAASRLQCWEEPVKLADRRVAPDREGTRLRGSPPRRVRPGEAQRHLVCHLIGTRHAASAAAAPTEALIDVARQGRGREGLATMRALDRAPGALAQVDAAVAEWEARCAPEPVVGAPDDECSDGSLGVLVNLERLVGADHAPVDGAGGRETGLLLDRQPECDTRTAECVSAAWQLARHQQERETDRAAQVVIGRAHLESLGAAGQQWRRKKSRHWSRPR